MPNMRACGARLLDALAEYLLKLLGALLAVHVARTEVSGHQIGRDGAEVGGGLLQALARAESHVRARVQPLDATLAPAEHCDGIEDACGDGGRCW